MLFRLSKTKAGVWRLRPGAWNFSVGYGVPAGGAAGGWFGMGCTITGTG